MSRLPFGVNPFEDPTPTVAIEEARPTASFLARQTIPPRSIQFIEKTDHSKKRSTGETTKAGKKVKTTTDDRPFESVPFTFGSLASENYS